MFWNNILSPNCKRSESSKIIERVDLRVSKIWNPLFLLLNTTDEYRGNVVVYDWVLPMLGYKVK